MNETHDVEDSKEQVHIDEEQFLSSDSSISLNSELHLPTKAQRSPKRNMNDDIVVIDEVN